MFPDRRGFVEYADIKGSFLHSARQIDFRKDQSIEFSASRLGYSWFILRTSGDTSSAGGLYDRWNDLMSVLQNSSDAYHRRDVLHAMSSGMYVDESGSEFTRKINDSAKQFLGDREYQLGQAIFSQNPRLELTPGAQAFLYAVVDLSQQRDDFDILARSIHVHRGDTYLYKRQIYDVVGAVENWIFRPSERY